MAGTSGAGAERSSVPSSYLREQPPANVFLHAPKMRTELPDPPMDLKLLSLRSASGTLEATTGADATAEPATGALASTSAAALARKALQVWEQERELVDRLALCVEGMRPPGGIWLLELAAAFADTLDPAATQDTDARLAELPWTYRPLRGMAAQLVRSESALASFYAAAEAERNETVDEPTSLVQSLGRVALSSQAAGGAFQALNSSAMQWMRPPQYDEFLSLKAGGHAGGDGGVSTSGMALASPQEAGPPTEKRSAAEIAADALAAEAEFEAAAQIDQRLGELSYPLVEGEETVSSAETRQALKSLPLLPDEQLWSQPTGLVTFTEAPASWQSRTISYGVVRHATSFPSLAFFTQDASSSAGTDELVDEFIYQLETPAEARELAGFMCLHITEDTARITPVQYRIRPRPPL
jgi:hypothetical protein